MDAGQATNIGAGGSLSFTGRIIAGRLRTALYLPYLFCFFIFVETVENMVFKRKFSDEKTFIVSEIESKISESKAEMIKWTFTFVTGALLINILAIVAAMFTLVNMLKK